MVVASALRYSLYDKDLEKVPNAARKFRNAVDSIRANRMPRRILDAACNISFSAFVLLPVTLDDRSSPTE